MREGQGPQLSTENKSGESNRGTDTSETAVATQHHGTQPSRADAYSELRNAAMESSRRRETHTCTSNDLASWDMW